MLTRHALLALGLAAAGLAVGGANVLADDEGELRRELHVVRSLDPVVVDRTSTLRRLDRVLAGIDEIAALTPTPPGRVPGHGRWLRDDGGAEEPRSRADDAERERPGSEPVELRHVPPPLAGRAIEERLDAMRREILVLRREVLRAPEVVPERVVCPMEDRAFRAFVLDLRRAPFARDKVALVEDVALHAHFTASQAETVVRAIESWGQVDAAVVLYPRVVDPESFHLVVNAVTFASDRDELRRRLRR